MKHTFTFLAMWLCMAQMAQAQWTSWQTIYENENDTFTKIDFLPDPPDENGFTALVVGKNGLIKYTEDGGLTWDDRSDTSLGDILYLDFFYDTLAFIANHSHVYRSHDQGKTWKEIYHSPDNRILGVFNYINVNTLRTFVFGLDDLRLYSLDQGDTWKRFTIKVLPMENKDWYHYTGYYERAFEDTISIFVNQAGVYYARGYTDSYFEYDFSPAEGQLNKIHFPWHILDGKRENYYLAIGDNECVYVNLTKEDRHTFDNLNGATFCIDSDSFQLTMVGDNGMIQTKFDWGSGIWNFKGSPAKSHSNVNLNWVDVGGLGTNHPQSGLMYFAVGDGVILRRSKNFFPVQVAEQQKQASASLQVFPNPSAAQAQVAIQLEQASAVQLSIYSIDGQLLQEPIQQNLQAGSHQFPLPSLSPGIYVVMLQTESGTLQTRVVME